MPLIIDERSRECAAKDQKAEKVKEATLKSRSLRDDEGC